MSTRPTPISTTGHPPTAGTASAWPDPAAIPGVSDRDGLTGRLAAELSRARRHGDALTVLHLDLVDFAAVNAHAGRAVGDDVLRRVGLGMAAALRGEDLVARVGGDSFAVVLPGLTGGDLDRVIARLVAVVDRVRVDGVDLPPIRVGIGAATYPADGATVDALLGLAAERQRDARAARRAARRHRETHPVAPPAEPVVYVRRWPVLAALRLGLLLAAPVVVAWFALPLLIDTTVARTGVLTLAKLVCGVAFVLVARRVGGRERLGWSLLAAMTVVTFIPVAGHLIALMCGFGGLLVAADGWLADRFRRVDALCFMALAAGALCTFALPSREVLEAAPAADLVGVVLRVAGASLMAAAILAVLTSVSARARPDAWMLAFGYLTLLVSTTIVVHRAGVRPPIEHAWQLVLALTAVNGIAAAWLRLHGPRRATRALRDAHADGALPVTACTAGVVALLVAGVLVDGDIPLAAALALIAVSVLRHVRTRVIAVDNRRLVERALRSEAERAAQHRASLVALTAALEARDGYTGRHGEETVSLAVRVADALGLADDERREVETVALLHDVGKIGTPNEILHKPGPLTDEEWLVMREHPIVGERILRTVPGLERVARAVRHEHERWDGGGYPDGIGGEEIPLGSRIVLVCDAYHAMTSDRPYRSAMPVADALAELERHAGSQFDPAVVRALVDVLAGDRGRLGPPVYQAAS